MRDKKSALFIAVALVFALLLIRLFQLQVVEGGRYRQIAEDNTAKTILAPAARGVIYDRNGKVLVENRPVFMVQVLPSILASKDLKKRGAVLAELSKLLGQKVEYKVSADQPIIVKDHIDEAVAIRIEERKRELEGVAVAVRPVRLYPHVNTAAHLLGYVGEIEPDELARLKEAGYRLGDWIGKDGVEKQYDKLIRGIDGGRKVEVDVYGKPTRMLDFAEPVPGADVKLTIDLPLQEAAEQALGNKAGAVVILDPRTGEILALVSRPNYDPNVFIDPFDKSKAAFLLSGRHPFMNRALAIYPPGSIFKVVTLSAALEEGLTKPNESFYCPGYYKINNRIAKCWKEGGHGQITAQEGLTQSCDIVFYELGRRLGPDKLAAYARKYGLGEKTGVDLPQEKRGQIPTSEWKRTVFKEQWYDGDSINYGIGQGFVQVTPLQMAAVYSEIAVGRRMKPFIVREIKSQDGEVLYSAQPEEVGRVPISLINLSVIKSALRAVVERATGIAAKVEGLPAAGKTGTAQTPGLPHAWFLCYAPADDPKFVIASFVEHGEHGDRAAAYVARDILIWYNKTHGGTSEAK